MNPWWRLVRFGFRLLYNEMAFTYDAVSQVVSLGDWRCWQRSVLEYLTSPKQHPRILELAHGTGDLQLDLYQAGYSNVVGFDLSTAMGRITSRKLRKSNLPVFLVRGEGQQLPFASQYFDAIVCTFPTNFLFETQTLKEIYRVLSAGGQLITIINGEFTRQNVLTSALHVVYRATGQKSTQPALTEVTLSEKYQGLLVPFRSHGFDVRLISHDCGSSIAVGIVATKP